MASLSDLFHVIKLTAHFGGRVGSPGHTAQHSPLGIIALGQSTAGQNTVCIIMKVLNGISTGSTTNITDRSAFSSICTLV